MIINKAAVLQTSAPIMTLAAEMGLSSFLTTKEELKSKALDLNLSLLVSRFSCLP